MTVYRLPTRHTREHQEEEVPSHPNGIYEHGTVSAKPWLCSASADAHAVTAIQHDLTAKKLLSLHYPSTELDPTLVERLCGIAYETKAARVNAFGPMAFCESTSRMEGGS